MRKKLILIILVTLIVTIVASYVNSNKDKMGLRSPGFMRSNPSVSPSPSVTPESPQTPKTFEFDSSTDLEAELEKVNPEVLDSDFE